MKVNETTPELIAIFCFYNISSGVQARLAFSNEFKHCNIITFDGKHHVNMEFDSTGIVSRVLDAPSTTSLIRGLKTIESLTAMVVVSVETRHKHRWWPWWVRSCNELDRYIGGVDIGFTFNPMHLYAKLLRYGNGRRNYHILDAWRRKDGILWRGRQPQSGNERPDERTDQAESSGVGV